MKRRSFLMMLGLAPIAPAAAKVAPPAEAMVTLTADKIKVMSLSEISRTLGSVQINNAVISSCTIGEITHAKICANAVTAGQEWYASLKPIKAEHIAPNAFTSRKLKAGLQLS